MATWSSMEVRVITQLSGSDGQHDFSGLPASTTVGDLKAKLSQALEARPTVDHQRLIYRGHLLATDTQTLADAFGRDAPQPHILHLVVRDAAPHRHSDPRSTSPRPNVNMAGRGAGLAVPGAVPHAMPPRPFPFANPPFGHAAPDLRVQPQTPFDFASMRAAAQQAPMAHHQHQFPPHHVMGMAPPPFPFPPPAYVCKRSTSNETSLTGTSVPNMASSAPGSMFAPDGRMNPVPSMGNRPTNITGHRSLRGSPDRSSTHSNGHAGVHMPHSDSSAEASAPRADGTAHTEGQPLNAPPPQHQGMRFVTGPSGEILSMTYTSGPVMMPNHPPAMPFPPHFGPRPPNGDFGFGPMPSQQPPPESRSVRFMPNWPGMPALGMSREFYGSAHAIDSMQLYHDDLARLLERMRETNPGTPPQQPQPGIVAGFRSQAQGIIAARNRAQQMLNDLLIPGRYPYHNGLSASDVSRLQALQNSFLSLVQTAGRELERLDASSAAPSQSTPVRPSNSSQPATRSGSPNSASSVQQAPAMAYLLNAPNGSQAIVFNSRGIFSTPEPRAVAPSQQTSARPDLAIEQLRALTSNQQTAHRSPQERVDDRVARAREAVLSLNRELASANEALAAADSAVNNMQTRNAARARSAQRNQVQNGEAVAPQADVPPQVAQVQAPGANDRNNELNNWFFEILWHTWTIFKLSALVWLFTRGMSIHRIIIVLAAGIVYIAANMGMFGDYWDRLRGHFEGLLGLPQIDDVGQAGQANNVNPPVAPAGEERNGRRERLPNPQAVAERLLHQRREQDRSWLTERLIPIERALALFVASLYPGVGERHIQARERQLVQQRQRQEEAARAAAEAEANRSQSGNAEEQSVLIESHGDGQPGSSSAVDASEGNAGGALRERAALAEGGAA